MSIDISSLQCPSCYRRGEEAFLEPVRTTYELPSGKKKPIFVYECECGYETSQPDQLYHEFRVRYHRALDVLLHIRGWCKSLYNSPPGKVWTINQAVETYFTNYQLTPEVWDAYKESQQKGE